MDYLKKIKDILEYYFNILGNEYFAVSKDWNSIFTYCKWIEENNLLLDGKPFKVSDYKLSVPIYNNEHEPSGQYRDIIGPDLPLLVSAQNIKDETMIVKLLKDERRSRNIKNDLEKLIGMKILDSIVVMRQDLVDYNDKLYKFMREYSEKFMENVLPIMVAKDGVYTHKHDNILDEQELDEPPQETLLPEELIAQYNVLGFLSLVSSKAGPKNDLLITSKGSSDKN